MANQWLRLWHDMPTDPKWRTIARLSGQPISLVQAIYLHLLVEASRNVTRGHAAVTAEDLASALDVTDEQVEAVLQAMQGRVLDGDYITGWEKRQPKREDAGDAGTGAKSAAQRKREQRDRDRQKVEDEQSHDASRKVTPDKEEDKDTEGAKAPTPIPPKSKTPKCDPRFEQFWRLYPNRKAKAKAEAAWLKLDPTDDLFAALMSALGAQAISPDWTKDAGQFVPHPATWINQRRWEDEVTHATSPQPDRSGPLSAVDRVKHAIATREAQSGSSGWPLAEDDGDVRQPLDGEFRRVG